MKKLTLLLLLTTATLLAGCTNGTQTKTTENNTLTVYAYDSLTAEYGLLPQILSTFEADTNSKIAVISFDDTGSMMNQLIVEQDNPQADIVMGLDNVDYPRLVEHDLLTTYLPERSDEISDTLRFDDEFKMTPFDYGYIGFVYDTEKVSFAGPVSLATLASSTYADQVIIEQAGLSSPGTQLLLWTNAALSETKADAFWLNMADNVFQVAPDWSTAYYNLFLEGEAPIVLSYLTSPAYHLDQEQTDRYQAVEISEGYIRQVEGIGIVNGSNQKELAGKFIDYVLTDDVQNKIPTTQWVFPVLGDAETWPAAFSEIIVPEDDEILTVSSEDIMNNLDLWIEQYNTTFNLN